MKKDILIGLAWAGAIVLTALAATTARKLGYIDGDAVVRVVAMNGLMVAWYGNLMPKKIVPSAHARSVNRFAGWTLVLSGLAYAGFWAVAPIPVATLFGTGSLAAGVLLTIAYCLWLRSRTRASA
jgi:hypothetical protein